MKGANPFENILVFLDSGEASTCAVMYSILLAKASGAAITAVFNVDTKALNYLVKSKVFLKQENEDYEKELEEDAKRHLNQAKKLAASKGVTLRTVTVSGSAVSSVNALIKDEGFDLLVLGGIGEIRSRREELTSDEDRLLRTCPCPVMVVREDDNIWQHFEEAF